MSTIVTQPHSSLIPLDSAIMAHGLGSYSTRPSVNQPDDITDYVEALLSAGKKALAKRHHPDVGGDTHTMQRINAAYDWVLEMVSQQKSAL